MTLVFRMMTMMVTLAGRMLAIGVTVAGRLMAMTLWASRNRGGSPLASAVIFGAPFRSSLCA